MKIVIINGFSTYSHRVELLYNYFKTRDNQVNVLYANFDHIKKEAYNLEKNDYFPIDTKPYYKNLSIKRLLSHFHFAKRAIKFAETLSPEMIYVVLPPNSLAFFAAKYKQKNKNIKLVYDIIDLWPETLPYKNTTEVFPFSIWKNLRNKNLNSADKIIVECNLFGKVIKKYDDSLQVNTLYMANKNVAVDIQPSIDNTYFDICYLGSINNIIDIEEIILILKELNRYKNVCLHIIGDGENRIKLIEGLEYNSIQYKYYGKVYDYEEKADIMNRCIFGLNIMKDTVCVGLTMKSIDYFQFGLPLLNNIKEDTNNIVNDYKVGFNLYDNHREVAKKIKEMKRNEFIHMKHKARAVYEKYFSEDVFEIKADSIFYRKD